MIQLDFALKFVSLPLLSYTLSFALYDPVAPPPFSIKTKRWLIIPSTVIWLDFASSIVFLM